MTTQKVVINTGVFDTIDICDTSNIALRASGATSPTDTSSITRINSSAVCDTMIQTILLILAIITMLMRFTLLIPPILVVLAILALITMLAMLVISETQLILAIIMINGQNKGCSRCS